MQAPGAHRVRAVMLHEGILQQAHHYPEATAVVEIDSRDTRCRHSFGELRSFALEIRRTLSPLLVREPDSATAHHVGILAEGGGLGLYAAWLAVLWEGCTVVPLSAGAQAYRLSGILADAMVMVVLLTDDESAAAAGAICQAMKLRGHDLSVVDIRRLPAAPTDNDSRFCCGESDMQADVCATEPTAAAAASAADGDAYLYYTSGSSGEPKGVHSGHAPMMNRLRWMWEQWPFDKDEVCCQRVDHVFIDFVAEVFGPLSCGVPILVVPGPVRRNPVLLGNFISEYGVTRITLVPTLARLVAEAARMAFAASEVALERCSNPGGSSRSTIAASSAVFKSVRLWILSGEALPWAVARELARLSTPRSLLLNLYGSTEMAADITAYCSACKDVVLTQDGGEIGAEDGAQLSPTVPIGCAIANCGVELMEMVESSEGAGTHGTVDGRPPKSLHRIDTRNHGRVGMLYVCGAGLARGYWGRPTATETNFPCYVWDSPASCYRLCVGNTSSDKNSVSDREFGDSSSSSSSSESGCRDGRVVRFFRTGDLASFEGGRDGERSSLIYRGRSDQQIKLNGRRFDLAEVEACLVQADGVALGSAVALPDHDTKGEQDFGGPQGCSLASGSLVGAVVSPETVDTAIVLAMCRQCLPSFAVPHVVVKTSVLPTLPGSGKVDRRAVRRMVLAYRHHQSRSTGSIDNNDGSASIWIRRVEDTTRIITEAVACVLQPFDGQKTIIKRAEIDDGCDLFTELGLSSVQAVHLVHELRRKLPAVAVSLVDLYSHPCARSLARWLLRAISKIPGDAEVGKRNLDHTTLPCVSPNGGSSMVKDNIGSDVVTPEVIDANKEKGVGFSIRPMTADRKAETYSLFTHVFLTSEPLMSSRLRSCRAKAGPVAAAIVRRCYNRLVVRSIDRLEERGGRVLIATDDSTGRVLGVTIGTELVESALGAGFLASGIARAEGLAEDTRTARAVSTNFDRTEDTAWQRCTGRLLGLPLQLVMRPVSALIDELLRNYHDERGWAYEPGEVMYISETGCRSARSDGAESISKYGFDRTGNGAEERTKRGDPDGSGGEVGDGVHAALLAESLERQLLREASAAGFLRAVTICTNAVTAYVARELGFKEVTRISPVQTYSDRQAKAGLFRLHRPRMSRQRFLSSSEHSVSATRGKHNPRPGPFASVGQEHADAILFEKMLVPSVPRDLLLDRRKPELAASVEVSVAVPAEVSFAAATIEKRPTFEYSEVFVAFGERWQLVRACQAQWEHHCQMLAMLADSLPGLASTGKATRFMTDDEEQGQAAFLLLTAPATAGRPEVAGAAVAASAMAARDEIGSKPEVADSAATNDGGSAVSSPSSWTVAACMSWKRQTTGLSGISTALDAERTANVEGSENKQGAFSSKHPPKPWRELLVLAVGRRWRYRGLGTALVVRLIAASREVGDSLVYVRSLPESVGFYERHGFRPVHHGEDVGDKRNMATPMPSPEGECLLVHDLSLAETHCAHDPVSR